MNRGIQLVAMIAHAAICGACFAGNEGTYSPAPSTPQPEFRSGGALEESYAYHRMQPMRSAIEKGGIPQANGWYNYGFPMQSYRYGWFGAAHYYPRVSWHEGYYGDCGRTSYRRRH